MAGATSRYFVPDSGQKIGEILGLETRSLSSQAWQEQDHPEVPFLSVYGNAKDIWC